MVKRLRKIKWDEGVSEMLSFVIVVPFVVLLICSILSAEQISAEKQKLTYAAYVVGRAAVVCENEEYAEARTDAMMQELYGNDFVDGGFQNSLKPAQGCSDTYYSLELVGDGTEWQKGNMVKCTVYRYITPLMPFTSGYRESTIVMMIENGVNSGTSIGDYTG